MVEEFKKGLIRRMLEQNNWNVSATAKALGLQRTYLHKLIRQYKIKRGQ